MQTPRPEYVKDQIYSDTYKDIYFCEEDGLDEGDHVFLKGNSLPENWQNRAEFVIAETGFGTGLNFLATWLKWEKTAPAHQHLTYISFEKFPLTPDQIREALSRWKDEIGDKLEIMLDHYPLRIFGWHPIRINDQISLLLIFDDVNRALPELNTLVDAWFLDGFAPAKNPEMWSEAVFKAMADNSYEGTTFASFTAAGLVKRGLREQGFHVAKTRGYGRKRDMIYGHFVSERQNPKKGNIRSVAVIGGGLAGTQIAARLQLEGVTVDLYEEKEIAAKASGNPLGLFNPRFTSQQSAISDFYASAFAYAVRQFSRIKHVGYRACGSLFMLTDTKKEKRIAGMVENCGWNPDHLRIVNADEASELAGVRIENQCAYLPDAGSISPANLCAELSKGISLIKNKVNEICPVENGWHVNNKIYDAVVLACGSGIWDFKQISQLPLSTVRGQIIMAKVTEKTACVKANICYGGYFSPAENGQHAIGATFQPWIKDDAVRTEDSEDIISNLEYHVPALKGEIQADQARAAFRVATKDRFPVIGKIDAYDNLYISAAHGSHGLISTALAAEIIAADIMCRPCPIPKEVSEKLSPQRFTEREAKK